MYLFVCLFDCTRVWSHAHLVSFCLTLVTIFAEIPYGHISLHVICSSILESTCSEDYDMTGLRNQTPFRSGDLNPRFSVIFPPMIWIFMWSEEPEIKSKQAFKRDRTLSLVKPKTGDRADWYRVIRGLPEVVLIETNNEICWHVPMHMVLIISLYTYSRTAAT